MKHILVAVAVVLLPVALAAQTQVPKPGPEHQKYEVWVGDWNIDGTAKDSPSGLEEELVWTIQCRWIMQGFFLEARHTWKVKGVETTALEILGYDPSRKTHYSHVFASDGVTESSVASFKDGTFVISSTGMDAEGKPTVKWRNTFTFSPDRMTFSLKGEQEKDGMWWTALTGKGTRVSPKTK